VAAYEKLGARYGGWVKGPDDSRFNIYDFARGSKQAEKGLPGFVIPESKTQFSFPQVSVPFALDLTGSREVRLGVNPGGVTDADLKQVAIDLF
jgi:hypothetical protein